MNSRPLSDTESVYRLQRYELIRLVHFQPWIAVQFCLYFHYFLKSFWAGNVSWIGVSSKFLHLHFLHILALTRSHCADLPMKFHWGSPLLSSPLLSLLSYSSVHLILSFLLHWGKRRFVTHYLLLLNDGRLRDEDYPLTLTEKTDLLDPDFSRGQKMGTKTERCPKREVGEQLMMLPEDVLEVWRDVNYSHSYHLLPPSLPFSLFLPLAAFRACSKHFWDPGHLPFFSSFPFVRESLFVPNYRWGLAEIEERHLHCLTELRHFLKAPWRAMGRDRSLSRHFRYGNFLLISAVCFVLLVLTCIWSCWRIVVQLFSVLSSLFWWLFHALCQHVKLWNFTIPAWNLIIWHLQKATGTFSSFFFLWLCNSTLCQGFVFAHS